MESGGDDGSGGDNGSGKLLRRQLQYRRVTMVIID